MMKLAFFTLPLFAAGCPGPSTPPATDMAQPPGDMAMAAGDMAMSGGDMAMSGDMAMAAGPTCMEYCTTVMGACTAGNAQYVNLEQCLGYCGTNYGWPGGTANDMSGNTRGCRVYHANAAKMNAMVHCPHAGPSGGNVCGTWCENYCFLAMRNCTGNNAIYADIGACMTSCGAIPSTGKPNAAGGDSIQCRIYHMGIAGTDAPSAVTHCPHGKPAPAPGPCTGSQ